MGCQVEGCNAVARSRGWCSMHYARWQRTGDPTALAEPRKRASDRCAVDACGSPTLARGWCSKHYDHWRRWGDPLAGKVRFAECVEDGCSRQVVGQGWCETHYSRFVRSPARKEARAQSRVDRRCANCGEPIPVERNASAAFCSRACKTAARSASGGQRESSLRHYYKSRYGLTPERVEEMRRAGCAICGSASAVGRHGQLHVDHCHKTGRIRGVLCSECNTGLGKFRDRPDLLRKAIEYLTAEFGLPLAGLGDLDGS